MEFKAQRRKLRVTIEDNLFSVAFPKVFEIEKFQKDSKGAGDNNALGILIDFLASLGLPTDASRSLEPDDLQNIVRVLTGQKKS